MEKDFIVVNHGFEEFYIPLRNILYVKGSTAHGSDDAYILRLTNGEEIEQTGFQALRAKMQSAEKFVQD